MMESFDSINENLESRMKNVLLSLAEAMKLENSDQLQSKLNQFCRTCLSQSKSNDSNLSSYIDIDGVNVSIMELLSSLTSVKILFDDTMSKTICSRCLQIVKFCYDFKQQCEEVDRRIRKFLNTNNIEKEHSIGNIHSIVRKEEMDIGKTFRIVNIDNLLISTEQKFDESAYAAISNETNADSGIVDEPSNCLKTKIEESEDQKDTHSLVKSGKLHFNHYNFENHSIRPITRSYKCTICSKDFKYNFKLKEHMKGHEGRKEFICESCGKGFNRAKELATHKRVHTGLKPYSCSVCQKSFVGSDTLSKHMKIHTGEKNYICEYCIKSFVAKDQLIVHIRKHTGEKPYLCSFKDCNRAFATIHSLNVHVPVHSDEKPYSCSTCGKLFSRKCDKKKHESIHTRQNYVCSWINCNRSYTCQISFKKHLSTHSNENQIQCSHCGKSFTRNSDLKRHILTHTQEKPFKCTQCDRGFNQQFGLTQHMRYHEGKVCFVCDLCGKGFMRKGILEKHKLIHSGIKNHKCEYCNKSFTTSAHLVNHKRIHTGERPYKCDICEKAFATRSGYVIHLRSHVGDKPYKCKICEKMFVSSSALKVHIRNHTGEEPYTCPHCNMTFSRSDLRSLHMKTCLDNLSEIIAPHQVSQDFYMQHKDMSTSSEQPIIALVDNNLTPHSINANLMHVTSQIVETNQNVSSSVMFPCNSTNMHGIHQSIIQETPNNHMTIIGSYNDH